MPFNERALCSDPLQEFRYAVRQHIPCGRMLSICSRLREQVPNVGRHIQPLVAHEDLHGKGQGPDECPKAFDDGFLLVLGFERQVDGRDFEHGTIAAPRRRAWSVQTEHISLCFAQAHHVALDTGLFTCRLHHAFTPIGVSLVCWLALSSISRSPSP